MSRGVTGNAIPPFSNPLLTAHAVQQSRRPTGRQQGGTCQKCGTSHKRGNCPAYGVKCHRCGGSNHFKRVCRSRNASSSSKQGGQSLYQKKGKQQQQDRRSSGNYNKGKGIGGGNGKGGGTPGKKKPFYKDKKKVYAVTLKRDSVLSEASEATGPVYESNMGKVKSENPKQVRLMSLLVMQFIVN